MRADLSDGWVAGRASARAARSIALRRLRVLWTAENMSFIPMSIGVGAVCGVLAAVMIRLAPFFGARLSTTATHILAIPCGIVVGLCIGVAFLALGAVALGAAVLLVATTAIGLYALATTVYGLLVVSARVALARAKSRHTTAD